jgi:alkylresorcinol/alkylpyrone synthase
MPTILGTGIAHPPYTFHQSDLKPFIKDMFADVFSDLDRLLQLFENTHIQTRHFCVPLEWFRNSPSFKEKNSLYVEHAFRLSIEAIQQCLERVNVDIKEISHLFFVSTTGMSTPSMDARIINALNPDSHMKRTPIWGLGCAGGAAGISRAFDYVKAYPKELALIVSVELCGLTFQRNDLTKSNLVATSLFADGAACVLLAGDEVKIDGKLRVQETMSTLWKDSLDVMGWDFSGSGFHVIFSRDIPSIVKRNVAANVQEFMKKHQIDCLDHYLLHPGGQKVLDAYETSLSIPAGKTDISRSILREYGNMSSCTVLYVLDRFIQENRITSGETGLISALGPGFSSELLLITGV